MEKEKEISQYYDKAKTVLIAEEEVKAAVKKAGEWIDGLYDGRPILLVSILKSAFVFLADLCRAVRVPCEIGFMCAKSYYSGTQSSGVVQITMDLSQDISGYHVVIVEDIVDTGITAKFLLDFIDGNFKTKSTRFCSLLDKKCFRKTDRDRSREKHCRKKQ